MQNLPNILTLSRILIIPIFIVLMILDYYLAAVIVFIIAAITDFIDGIIARKFGYVSDLGKLLDPLADKILVMTALVMLLGETKSINCDTWIPAWMVVVILAREIWVTGLRAVAAEQGLIIPAGITGKVKSFIQMLAIIFLLLHDQVFFNLASYSITFEYIGIKLLVLSVFFSVVSALDYTKRVLIKK